MSLGHGAKIIRDGLVFYYDMANTAKSWIGRPTTNLIPNPSNEINGGEFTRYANLASIFDSNGLVPYSLSMDIKANKEGNVLFYMQNGSSTKYGFVYERRDINTEYQRVTFNNITPNLSNTSDTQAWFAIYTTYGSGVRPSVKNIQLELGTTATPFVDGTRPNTEALLDISPAKRTITAPSFDYNANGDFSFSGDDILYTGLFSGRSTSSAFTVEAWVKSDVTSGARMWVDVGGNGSSQRFYSSLIHPQAGNPMGIQGNGWSTSVPYDTNWHHQTIVMDGSTAKGYCDGELVHTKGYTSYNLPGSITIGGRSGYYWDGNISIVKIYEKALTEQEIKQNFEAHRARYGI